MTDRDVINEKTRKDNSQDEKAGKVDSEAGKTVLDFFKSTVIKLANALFPTDIYCICCGSIIDSTRTYSICDSCIQKFRWATGRTCQKCGKPLAAEDPHACCFDCRTIPHNFDKGYTCCLYDLYARAVVMDMKYRDKSYLCRIVGDILADRMIPEFDAIAYESQESTMDRSQSRITDIDREGNADKNRIIYDLIISVPVSKKRMDERGYNQADLIARQFSERTEIPYCEDVLERSDRTIPMKDLDAMQRRLNVKGAFSVTTQGEELIQHKRIMLIDDIYTTGSTLDECARMLKEAGALKVDILTFAAGRNYVPRGEEKNLYDC